MGVNSISGGMPGSDSQLLGAQVVSKTLDYMNHQPSTPSFAPVDKQTFGAAVVSKTMDYLNAPMFHSAASTMGGMGGMSETYGLNKDVLGAYATGVGALANLKV